MITVLAPSILPILLDCLITRVTLISLDCDSYPVESSDTLAGLVTPASLVTPVTLNSYILKAKKFAEPLFQSKKFAEKVRKSGRHFWAIWG